MNLIRQCRIRRVNGDGCFSIHVEQRGLHRFNHLITTSTVKCHLIVRNHDAEITAEAVK